MMSVECDMNYVLRRSFLVKRHERSTSTAPAFINIYYDYKKPINSTMSNKLI